MKKALTWFAKETPTPNIVILLLTFFFLVSLSGGYCLTRENAELKKNSPINSCEKMVTETATVTATVTVGEEYDYCMAQGGNYHAMSDSLDNNKFVS